MNIIEELTEYFRKFPGVGPRQANRFVYFLLRQDENYLKTLSQKILELKSQVSVCPECFHYFTNRENVHNKICEICQNPNREKNKLMLVATDNDLKAIEKSGTYNGLYFVLGGNVPIMYKSPEKIIRINSLLNRLSNDQNILEEIIFALSTNPEGENTISYVSEKISHIITEKNIKTSKLGRGLSTGAEIEYSDVETLKNALRNRF